MDICNRAYVVSGTVKSTESNDIFRLLTLYFQISPLPVVGKIATSIPRRISYAQKEMVFPSSFYKTS